MKLFSLLSAFFWRSALVVLSFSCWTGWAQGVSLPFSEDFNGLVLGPNVDEEFEGDNVWTKTAPSDWKIDDSGVPGVGDLDNDGVTEWAGWSFADVAWWVEAAGDQGRSEFTLGTGAVAVADPDEWDDLPHADPAEAGWYDTFLTTPTLSLEGVDSNSVVLLFDSSWRPEFDNNFHQTAIITTSFDGGEPIQVMLWESDEGSDNYKGVAVNETVTIPLSNPEGASTVVIAFALVDAGNDWWWAIDNIEVTGERGAPEILIPEILSHPQNLSASVGESATFNLVAGGTEPLSYQWRVNGKDINGATKPEFAISAATLADAGAYTVVVSNTAGTANSDAAELIVEKALTVVSVTPVAVVFSEVVVGEVSSVSLKLENVGTANLEISSITSSLGDVLNISDTAFNVLSGTSHDLDLTLLPTTPGAIAGILSIVGNTVESPVEIAIKGNAISPPAVMLRHPADNNPPDNRISIVEVTAYGGAWSKGQGWPVDPNPIPIDYVTRAGALWKGGEVYEHNLELGALPLAWVNDGLGLQSVRSSRSRGIKLRSQWSKSRAVRTLPLSFQPGRTLRIGIQVTPSTGILSYALEETLPQGWRVAEINENGFFDPMGNKVRWGPFFDARPRMLSFSVNPANEAAGAYEFEGIASFDGSRGKVTGSSQTTRRYLSARTIQNGRFELIVTGAPGDRIRLERSEDLNQWHPWYEPGTRVTNKPGT
jgi:hypothetical protein